LNEFELIDRFFARALPAGGIVCEGVGDDCALLDCGERLLAITTDLLLEGRHFLPGVDPVSLGHKALAVNLSDLAAAGATPRAFQLALALPRADEGWLEAFCRGTGVCSPVATPRACRKARERVRPRSMAR